MKHKVVPCFPKVCHWPLASSWDHFGLHQEIKCKSNHGTQAPPKACFLAYIIHCNGPMGFGVREAKEVLSLQMSRDHDRDMAIYLFIYVPNVIVVKREEEGEKGQT